MPAVNRDVIEEVLIEKLVPVAHARGAHRVARPQRDLGKDVLEILVDDGRVGDDDAVVIEHRHLSFRVDREEPRVVLLELV